jgi:hypothetical protein
LLFGEPVVWCAEVVGELPDSANVDRWVRSLKPAFQRS